MSANLQKKAWVSGHKMAGYKINLPVSDTRFDMYWQMDGVMFDSLRAAQSLATAMNRQVLGTQHDTKLHQALKVLKSISKAKAPRQ